jgi:hypothetical protein
MPSIFKRITLLMTYRYAYYLVYVFTLTVTFAPPNLCKYSLKTTRFVCAYLTQRPLCQDKIYK